MDWNIEIDSPVEETPANERLDVPEGTHELQIVQVLEDDVQLEVRLAHDDRKYGWVFCRMPKGDKRAEARGISLGRALAMTSDQWRSTPAGDLVGRRVRADIWHRGRDDGRVWVNVSKFLPIEQLAAEAAEVQKRPARTPAAKVKAASPAIGSDDIPF